MQRRVEQTRFVPEDLLRAVSVMNIKIDDGDALQTVYRPCMSSGGSGVIEQAKTHRAIAFGMMPWWPHRTERVSTARRSCLRRGEHHVNRSTGCTCGSQGRLWRSLRDDRVGIERQTSTARCAPEHPVY